MTERFQGERTRKSLQASRMLTDYQKQYYGRMTERVRQGEPLIWTNVGSLQELMHAMDLPVLFNVNWSAILAAKQRSAHYLNVVNDRGYFRDLCRYCVSPLGYFFENRPELAPWGGVPKPAAIVVEVNCDPIIRVFELMALELGIPIYIWDHTMPEAPPPRDCWADVETIEKENYREGWRLDYAVQEAEGLIAFLETISGKALSHAALRRAVELSNEQYEYIGRVLELTKRRPSPIRVGDHWANCISTQFFRGHEFGLAHAKRLYEEVRWRADEGVAGYDNERIRLMHLWAPNWFSPGFYDSFEEKYGAVFVWTPYFEITQQWIRRDLSDPLRALASRYVAYTEIGTLPPWTTYWIPDLTAEYGIDGVLYQHAESCRMLSGPKLLCLEAIRRAGVPTLNIGSDYVDDRDWDDAKMKAQVGSFIETLL
ncbi:MAG: 2-hydroxyacyl-CoA dehydratase [Deltaproteobacteria bacterium]|nr:2-hydroxyacyl-CoA dehydratase [Deltaproteobacteria bacterium]